MAEEELDRFRKEWQQEVTARTHGAAPAQTASSSRHHGSRRLSNQAGNAPKGHRQSVSKGSDGGNEDVTSQYDYEDLETKEKPEPESALEHYERAVERETQGKLGDSLLHYRKAFKLDDRVDVQYKNKHFPPSSFAGPPKPTNLNPSNASATVPNTAHHSLHGTPATSTLTTGSELLASFAESAIVGAVPFIKGTPPPPCPIAALPQELLADILLRTALADVASFVRLAQACRRLAYVVGTDERIWRRVCQGPEWGFGAMHYKFTCALDGKSLPRSVSMEHEIDNDEDDFDDLDDQFASLKVTSISNHGKSFKYTTPCILPALPLLPPQYPTYNQMFHTRPRLRFSGLYISTVNYIRPGASTPSQATWTSPVHIVTYYRYLRFFRDGSCLSLLTTAEPQEVVPHMRQEVAPRAGKIVVGAGELAVGGAGLQAVAKHGLRGRWRLSGCVVKASSSIDATTAPTASVNAPNPSVTSLPTTAQDGTVENAQPTRKDTTGTTKQASNTTTTTSSPIEEEPEGHVLIETAGPTPAYTYSMRLSLESIGLSKQQKSSNNATGTPRNTRLAWEGFWSYNRLTDDWAEFKLKNDRAFVWSRVRSWGDA